MTTPPNNQKCHVGGSLVWRTGTLLVSPPERSRNAPLFLAHLDDLRMRLRGSQKIHVICDNAKFHNCRAVDIKLSSPPIFFMGTKNRLVIATMIVHDSGTLG